MGRGARYPHIEAILKKYYRGGLVLEIAAGGCHYSDIFYDYVGTDLPVSPYYDKGDLCLFCDGQSLPLKNNTVDFIFIVAALYQIQSPDSVVKEVHRVLKPSGQFIVFDYNKPRLTRLKRIENDGNNFDHIWLPWELETLIKKNHFNTRILVSADYSSNSSGKLLSMIYNLPGTFFLSNQLLEGWSIIHAEKGSGK